MGSRAGAETAPALAAAWLFCRGEASRGLLGVCRAARRRCGANAAVRHPATDAIPLRSWAEQPVAGLRRAVQHREALGSIQECHPGLSRDPRAAPPWLSQRLSFLSAAAGSGERFLCPSISGVLGRAGCQQVALLLCHLPGHPPGIPSRAHKFCLLSDHSTRKKPATFWEGSSFLGSARTRVLIAAGFFSFPR